MPIWPKILWPLNETIENCIYVVFRNSNNMPAEGTIAAIRAITSSHLGVDEIELVTTQDQINSLTKLMLRKS